MNRLQRIEKSLAAKGGRTVFTIGDTVRVHVKVVEGGKERIQVFEGLVIARSGGSSRETFTVRKVSYNTGVERVFPLNSPKVERIEVVRSGRVRRAKLYYLRTRRGKAARIAERDMRGKQTAADIQKDADEALAAEEAAAAAKAAKADEKAEAAEAPVEEAPADTATAPEAVEEAPVEAPAADATPDAPADAEPEAAPEEDSGDTPAETASDTPDETPKDKD